MKKILIILAVVGVGAVAFWKLRSN
jgi:hypothetical protein